MFLVPNHKELYKRRQKIFLEKKFFIWKKKKQKKSWKSSPLPQIFDDGVWKIFFSILLSEKFLSL